MLYNLHPWFSYVFFAGLAGCFPKIRKTPITTQGSFFLDQKSRVPGKCSITRSHYRFQMHLIKVISSSFILSTCRFFIILYWPVCRYRYCLYRLQVGMSTLKKVIRGLSFLPSLIVFALITMIIDKGSIYEDNKNGIGQSMT